MINKYKYTFLTLSLSAMVVAISILGMNFVLEKNEQVFLTEGGNIEEVSPVRPWDGNRNLKEDRNTAIEIRHRFLTYDQMKLAIDSWNNREKEIFHDPVEDQISMEQAIENGIDWMKSMQTLFYGSNIDTKSVNAVLGIGRKMNELDGQVDSFCSFWTVSFSDDDMTAKLYLNAVSGEVWGAEITLYNNMPEEMPANALFEFAELSGMQRQDGKMILFDEERNSAVLTLNDHAQISMSFEKINEKGLENICCVMVTFHIIIN